MQYAISYKVEIIERKDPIVRLEASKQVLRICLVIFLNETKGFKYQIIVKVLLKKYKHNEEIKFAPVYFNSVAKIVINHRFRLESYFQEILINDTWLMLGLIMDLVGLLNQLSLSILTFRLIDHYQEVLILTYLLN